MWEHALEQRADPADLAVGRADRRRLRDDRGDHRPQVAVVARALDAGGRPRRGGSLAGRPGGRHRGLHEARRARPGPRPGRRLECDLGEAGSTRLRRVGASPPACPLQRAGLRPVAGARRGRATCRVPPRAPRRFRLSPRGPGTGARPTRPHPRRRRLLRRDAPGPAASHGSRHRGCGDRAASGIQRGPARRGRRLGGARGCGSPPRQTRTRASGRAHAARARGAARAGRRRIEPGRSQTISASPPRPRAITSSTSTRRPAYARRAAATLWAFEQDLVHTA